MYYTKLNKSSYYDFVLTKDCKVSNRDYDNYKLFFIDVTKSLCDKIGKVQTENITLQNISLTGYDNFLINNGDGTIDPSVRYNISSGDTFCLNIVSGYTRDLKYEIIETVDYNELCGGFYQGFFKLYGYPLQYFAPRMRKGWTTNLMIHFPLTTGCSSGTTLNDIFTGNTGFIYYLGTRAENKFENLSLLDVATLTNDYGFIFKNKPVTEHPIDRVQTDEGDPMAYPTVGLEYRKNYYLADDEPYDGYYNITGGIPYSGRTYDSVHPKMLTVKPKQIDLYDNAFGVRITPDGRIGYRTIYESPCYTGETQEISGITYDTFVDFSDDCDEFTKGKIITKYITIEESYTRKPIINPLEEQYAYITIVYERDFSYDTECQLKFGEYKNGTLSIFLNGFNVYKNKHFSEVIPHELFADKRLQEAVPFTISFGGGTQGLYEALFLDPYKPINSLLEGFFGGTFEGGLNFIEMYAIPLDVTEIREKVRKELSTYGLYYPIGGRRIYIKSTNVVHEDFYSIFATTILITVATRQPFRVLYPGDIKEIKLVGETGGNKQFFEIPTIYHLKSVIYYNDLVEKWDEVNRITEFDVTDIIRVVNNENIQYKKYTYNLSDRGAMRIKLIF